MFLGASVINPSQKTKETPFFLGLKINQRTSFYAESRIPAGTFSDLEKRSSIKPTGIAHKSPQSLQNSLSDDT
jgi:hypothetical protein